MNIVFIPGMANHYLFRKIFIEEHTIKAIKQGAKQVIVIGSGFDFLAIRLSKHYPDVIFFEIDRPNTLSVKQTILCRINWHVPTNCLAIPIDLNKQDPASTLGEYKQFNVNAPTLVIMEGVLMYLFESEVKRLFCALRSLSEEKLSLIFGATVSCDDSARGPISLINTLLRRAGEGTNWHCPRAVIAQFLNNLGYQLVETITYKQLQRRFLSESEIINVPEEDENYYIAVAKDLAAVAPHVKN